MTFTISLAAIGLLAFSLLAFIGTTIFCHKSGMFDGYDSTGITSIFVLFFYAIFWAIPSLSAWAIWATFFRSAV